MELISAKIAAKAKGFVSKSTEIPIVLNTEIIYNIRLQNDTCQIYWSDLCIENSDDETIGYVLELLIDAGYEVSFLYEEMNYCSCGVVFSWGECAKQNIDDWFNSHLEYSKE